MPTPTYTPLATVTLGTAASSVTFSSIPATYRDLIVVMNARSVYSADRSDDLQYRFNADSGSNYSWVNMAGFDSSTASSSSSSQTSGRIGVLETSSDSNTNNGVLIFQVMDYCATDKHKTALSRTNIARNFVAAHANRWASTTAVTSINVFGNRGSNLAAGSTFSLYGVIA
jgi:hypothetical protein